MSPPTIVAPAADSRRAVGLADPASHPREHRNLIREIEHVLHATHGTPLAFSGSGLARVSSGGSLQIHNGA
jgi:hypothetical protein